MTRWIVAALIVLSALAFSYRSIDIWPSGIDRDGNFLFTFEKAVAREIRANSSEYEINLEILDALSRDDPTEARMYVDIANDVGFHVRPTSVALLQQQEKSEKSFENLIGKGFNGCFKRDFENTAELIGIVACDLVGVGDFLDIWNQGRAMLDKEEYDKIILGLSVVGAGLTVSTALTGGVTGSADAAASVIKTAKRSGKITNSFERVLLRQADDLVHPDQLGQIISKTGDAIIGLPTSIQFSWSLAPIKFNRSHFDEVGRMTTDYIQSARNTKIFATLSKLQKINRNIAAQDGLALAESIKLMKYVDNTGDLDELVTLSARLKQKTRGIVKLTKGRKAITAFKTTLRISDYVYEKIGALLILFLGIVVATLWLRISAKFVKK